MQREHKVHRLVVKVGTSTLTRETGSLNLQNMERLARVLSDLEGMGYQVVLVSSGAIGIGTKKLRLDQRPTELRMKQATAAVGQCMMVHIYDKLFASTTAPWPRSSSPGRTWSPPSGRSTCATPLRPCCLA